MCTYPSCAVHVHCTLSQVYMFSWQWSTFCGISFPNTSFFYMNCPWNWHTHKLPNSNYLKSLYYRAHFTIKDTAKRKGWFVFCTFFSVFCACGITITGSSSSVVRTESLVPNVKTVERFLNVLRLVNRNPTRNFVSTETVKSQDTNLS